MQEQPVLQQASENELGVTLGGLAILFAPEHGRGLRERFEHEPVPGRYHLLVAAGLDAPLALCEENASPALAHFVQLLCVDVLLARDLIKRSLDVEDVSLLEVSALGHVVVSAE